MDYKVIRIPLLLGAICIVIGWAGSLVSALLLDDLWNTAIQFPCFVLLNGGFVIFFAAFVAPQLPRVWRPKAVTGTALLAACSLLYAPIFWSYTYPGDRVRFLREYPRYSKYVTKLPSDGKRFAEFNWGGMLFASRGVTYDETDQVALPSGLQSVEWQARMKDTDLTCGGKGPVGIVEPMDGHYYLTTFGC